MRIIVCGSRTWKDEQFLAQHLSMLTRSNMPNVTIIHGAARGADRMAGEWARRVWLPVEEYPADWNSKGRAAGWHRNRQMLDEGKPDLVVAFVDKDLRESKGTKHMVSIAAEAGVPVHVYRKLGGPA